ncbi:stemmadenine O-acetyltransferase-like [Salvia hispanica]|uniref:stemmadenine O-acetyltransferase-like n=1 Tax=Salvia hispanica TaxID=49212 RepID=UPI002009377C|nr:stemmadenine O-acetyltransferase-like [Salvia hispanica]
MEIESRLISIETITPSSPTPKSLQKHQLSFFDQTTLPSFSHFVYLYSSNPKFSNSRKSKQLKKSLSEALSIYYPLAGRIVGNLYVDCNDAGIPFSEAEADCDLRQVITTQNRTNLKKFLPLTTDDLCLAVQATYLRCGGLAVGISLAHKISDALSFVLFVNTWSALARDGGAPAPLVKLDTATYAPPLDILQSPSAKLLEEEVTASTFLFSAPEIAALQERYTAAGGHRPSRVEALSAFIWTSYVSAVGVRSDQGYTCVVYNSINLRSRAHPPLSVHQFGNLIVPSTVEAVPGDSGVQLIRKMREASMAVNAGYVAGLKKREMQLEVLRNTSRAAVDRFFFSSVCRIPLYEADFGWGTPDRVINVGMPVKNVVYFMDTKSGGGIETKIQLTKADMEKLEALLMIKSKL